jgi:hypothetical protein
MTILVEEKSLRIYQWQLLTANQDRVTSPLATIQPEPKDFAMVGDPTPLVI